MIKSIKNEKIINKKLTNNNFIIEKSLTFISNSNNSHININKYIDCYNISNKIKNIEKKNNTYEENYKNSKSLDVKLISKNIKHNKENILAYNLNHIQKNLSNSKSCKCLNFNYVYNINTINTKFRKINNSINVNVRNNSCFNFKCKVNILNYTFKQSAINNIQNYIAELNQVLSRKRFYLIESDMFPLIFKINFLMKKVFTIMKSTTHQFEEVRKHISTNNIDAVLQANVTITKAFSKFYNAAEKLNKIYCSHLYDRTDIFIKHYNNFVLDLENRIKITYDTFNSNK